MALLGLVDEMTGDLFDLLADMRIAGLGASRSELTSAPRRFELAAELQARPAFAAAVGRRLEVVE